jgi:hypothetical protein
MEAPTLFLMKTVVIDAADRVSAAGMLEDVAHFQGCDINPLPLILAHPRILRSLFSLRRCCLRLL